MKLASHFGLALSAVVMAISAFAPLASAATFTPNLVIDDTVFDSYGSMSAAQIDAFLNTFGSSCISTNSGFAAIDPTGYNPTNGFAYGGYVSAGQVIYDAAQAYGINPQVLITTLEKEQSLVTGRNDFNGYCNDGVQHKYAAAVGYGCPDSGTSYSYTGLSLYRRNGSVISNTGTTCVNSSNKAGFTQQVIRAAWLFKFGEQRSEGNVSWAVIKSSWDNSDDPQSCYGGPMTQGTFQRCPSGGSAYYDGYTTIDGTATHMDTGATAALYWYTPHFSGNQSFFNLFNQWFGGTVSSTYYSCHNSANVPNTTIGEQIVRERLPGSTADTLNLSILNNTATACTEFHMWSDNHYQGWSQHVASNAPSADPSNSEVISANVDGKGSRLYRVDYGNTGSGMVEIHGWDGTMVRWASHIATNRPVISKGDARVIAADTNGDGKDEFYLIQYRNTSSGMVEIHGWAQNLQQWTSHIATNLPAINPAEGKIIAWDPTGTHHDIFSYIKFAGAQSGNVELHSWMPNFQQWASHIATNLSMADYSPTLNDIVAADTNGDGRDEILYVKYGNTSSARLEIHGWSSNMQQWVSHTATSSGAFPGP